MIDNFKSHQTWFFMMDNYDQIPETTGFPFHEILAAISYGQRISVAISE